MTITFPYKALGSSCRGVLTQKIMATNAPKRRRWFQFRLRTLLIAVLVLSLPLSWLTWEIEKMKRQRKIGAIIEGAGAVVSYEDAEPSVLQRIREFLGDDSVDIVVTAVLVNEEFVNEEGEVVNAGWDEFGDDEATYLRELPNLKILSLRNTQVSDAGLEQLEGLTNLKLLYLNDTQVTPEGVKKLQEALPNCKIEYQKPQTP